MAGLLTSHLRPESFTQNRCGLMGNEKREKASGGRCSRLNRLQYSKSPYLLQHAGNPVDWYPWGEEAFERARKENKPIFLSIGYSTCHWCHVMEHESFEDPAVAALMNETFVSIKVDREERPDIDKVYMSVCQMLTGSGGWPLTIIMTPQKEPFFAGTYFPKTGRFGRIGMTELVPRVSQLWQNRAEELKSDAEKIIQALRQDSDASPGAGELTSTELERAFEQLRDRFDSTHGGFGSAPKFPTPHNLYFLLRYWKRYGEPDALRMVEKTLEALRLGGIYDQLGFGFHRYSTDSEWLVPHFEKMLYDQALLALAYLETRQATGREDFARVAREIFTYVLRDMRSPEGAFYSAEDADSEGEEGKFYVWTDSEIRDVLEKEEAELVINAFNVAREGNFRDQAAGGANIFHLKKDLPSLACEIGMPGKELEQKIESARAKLYARREKRVRPGRDTKVLTDWNALMIAALARGARVLGEETFEQAARQAADFILAGMRDSRGRLFHRYSDGEAGIAANLDDYAFTVWALLELYETNFKVSYLEAALELNRIMLERFRDDSRTGGFYFTADDAEELLLRQKELYDGALPSGNSVAALNLLRLGRITADVSLEQKAEAVGSAFSDLIKKTPAGFTQFLCALDFALGPSFEIVIAQGGSREDTAHLLKALRTRFLPNKVVLLRERGGEPEISRIAPFTMHNTSIDNKATAYVCLNYNCRLPTTDPGRMIELIEEEYSRSE